MSRSVVIARTYDRPQPINMGKTVHFTPLSASTAGCGRRAPGRQQRSAWLRAGDPQWGFLPMGTSTGALQARVIASEKVMKQVSPSASLRGLARRYRRAEDAGFPDVLLTVVFAAGGLATGGIVLLAYVPTHAVLLVAYALAVAATLAVLLTIVAMVNDEEAPADSDPSRGPS
jgi:hypothetical protein